MENKKEDSKKRVVLKGKVVSDKMDKTITVLVARSKMNIKYKKKYAVSKKFKVHDEKNSCKEGDVVEFTSCRPMSKEKKWRVIYT